MLSFKFAYATNGTDIIEIDFFAGTEDAVDDVPKPQHLWERYQRGTELTAPDRSINLLLPITPLAARRPASTSRSRSSHGSGNPRRKTAPAAHNGDRHRQDGRCFSDLLEALVKPLEQDG